MTRDDNVILSRKMLPEKIKSLLDSDDIEMVRLGASMMREYVPIEFWYNVLDMFSYKGGEEYAHLYVKKWHFNISKGEITITPNPKNSYEIKH